MTVNDDCFVDLNLKLVWESEKVRHEERYHAPRVNVWRDILPVQMDRRLRECGKGDVFKMDVDSTRLGLPARSDSRIKKLANSRFSAPPVNGRKIIPRTGRFYPQGFLKGITGVFPQTMTPFRCLEAEGSFFVADLNHPFAGREASLEVEVLDVQEKEVDLGGSCRAWMEILADGPGMQAGLPGKRTDFFEPDGFRREDESCDSDYYSRPRVTAHVDSKTRDNIARLYSSFLRPGDRVLDLMASAYSHFPEGIELGQVKGLGMNSEEMESNPRLDAHEVRDLNLDPRLPFASGEFDAVVCAMSVEYLTSPVRVIAEANRILKPGGRLIITFSHRWFPGKAVNIWTEMHEFERLGFVSELVLQDGGFTEVSTFSERGWPRPFDERDRYYPLLQLSDPLFAVTAEKRA
jgi:SAM-dependent methyltransferase